MTRKHFEALAAITANISNHETRKSVAEAQASYFATQNPNFNRARYMTACNV